MDGAWDALSKATWRRRAGGLGQARSGTLSLPASHLSPLTSQYSKVPPSRRYLTGVPTYDKVR